ncbi:MAG: metallophosphoesterase family protein [Myxococcota bacterium]
MRVVHFSDLHYYAMPTVAGVFSKRLLGLANLYLRGRIKQFHADVAAVAIEQIVALKPELILLTGDLTALASPAEFEVARRALAPLLEHFPVRMVPGNHDCYTQAADREARIEQLFKPWLRSPQGLLADDAPPWPSLYLQDQVAVLGLNPARFHLGSSGKLQNKELERLEQLLQRDDVARRFKILMLHYPLLGKDGVPSQNRWRKLEGGAVLRSLLERHPVDLVLHGHDHLRYFNPLPVPGRAPIPLYNAGSAAFYRGADYPIHATFNVYTVEAQQLQHVQHYDYNGKRFEETYAGPLMTERWVMSGGASSHY